MIRDSVPRRDNVTDQCYPTRMRDWLERCDSFFRITGNFCLFLL